MAIGDTMGFKWLEKANFPSGTAVLPSWVGFLDQKP